MFKTAIVRLPCPGIKDGLSSSNLGTPVFEVAIEQHRNYVDTLRMLGLNVRILQANEFYPDSTFIEDVAICAHDWAVVTNPGAPTRRGETAGIRELFKEYLNDIETIIHPGTLEGGDVMKAGNHYFIGISDRTNNEGADQLIKILQNHGMTGEKVNLKNMLHLKSGVSYLENDIMLVSGEIADNEIFESFNLIKVEDNECYAANSLWVNGKVLVPDGFPVTKDKIEKAGFETIVLNVSEFRKVDGGLSCLSLRF